ncbi:tRNA threonylcarbamoyladenosine dehydratase [Entomospira culicis]|uniref:tRNA threonylcarbamoyladenosine dehydratase n=1 Tax=Entomospira culicis TaxID=2719989 RepID=UPI002367C0E9|nr:ThiF family adenylyltransferase [Entomospira culicis]WDI37843.1 ThiF family adenylyltransferase [Entomospira culicis]
MSLLEEDSRSSLLFGEEELAKIQSAFVAVIGLGGVGGYACEVLVRLGVKKLLIIDGDIITRSNINRQIITSQENIGKSKAEEFRERASKIRPDLEIIAIQEVMHKDNISMILGNYNLDLILDAIDSVGSKAHLIHYAKTHDIEIVSALGAAQRTHPHDFHVVDLFSTYQDPLARALRTAVKKLGIYRNVKAIFSKEIPTKSPHDVPKQLGEKSLGSYVASVMVAGALLADTGIQLLLKRSN